MGLARDGFMEEMSFPLDLERSTEFKLAEESQHEQGRVKSRSEGSEELGSDKNQLGARVRAWW